MELTKEFDEEQYGFALASWTFVDLSGLTAEFTSLFGDIFFRGPEDSWWYLDRTAGTLRPEWASAQEMVDELKTERGQDMYLLGGVALAAERTGMVLAPTEVFDWTVEPALGGPIDLRNITVNEFSVALAVAGQIHADQLAAIADTDPDDPS
jgi:hypothetical protein